jgi:hypothetical protein
VRALTGKEPRYRLADSGGGAGNQCDPIFQHGHIITRGAPCREILSETGAPRPGRRRSVLHIPWASHVLLIIRVHHAIEMKGS